MADNTVQTGTDVISTDDVTTLNGSVSSGVKVQRVKSTYGDDGTSRDVSQAFPLPVRPVSSTGTISSVSSSITVVTLLASNASRIGASIFNDSTATLNVALAAGASATVLTVKVPAGGLYEVPNGYTGIITGIWASANGAARVTELA
jgi:hypothetical protein